MVGIRKSREGGARKLYTAVLASWDSRKILTRSWETNHERILPGIFGLSVKLAFVGDYELSANSFPFSLRTV